MTAPSGASGPKTPGRRLGWLGPVLVAIGITVAGLGVLYMVRAKPVPGAIIDTIAIDPTASFVIRGEDGGERSFIELHVRNADGTDDLRWQALIPHYAGGPGRPAVAWSKAAMSVRVERDNREDVWALAMDNAQKAGVLHLAPEREPIAPQLAFAKPEEATVPLTLHDGVRSYELVGGPGWHEMIAIDLASGKALWKIELGAELVTRAEIVGGQIDLWQGEEHRRINALNGRWYYPDPYGSKPT